MKKRVFMALLAAVSTFAMVSCGDDKDDDPKPSGKIATEATYGETANSVYVEFPNDDIPTEMGTASTKIEWKFSGNDVIEYTATTTCSSSTLADEMYKECVAEKNAQSDNPPTGEDDDDDPLIKDVKKQGNNVIIYYDIPEGTTKDEAIIAAKFLAAAMGAQGVNTDDLIDDLFGDLDGMDFGDLEGAEE